MSSKMKKCIDKLLSRQSTPKKGQGEDLPREDFAPQVANKAFEGNESGETSKGGLDGVCECALLAGKGDSKQISKGETTPKQGVRRRAPTVKQKILDEPGYWGPTKQIEEARMLALLKREIKTDDDTHYKLVNVLNGAFNVAYILESSRGGKVCVRVPACGFPQRWNSLDAELLRATALGMKYIENVSKLPIPRILAYSAGLDNEINAPYTIMTFLEGKGVNLLWNEFSLPQPVLEARRQKILQSLATTMCTLSTTTFHTAGTLWFPDESGQPSVGESYRLHKDNIFTIKRDFIAYPPRDTVAELLREGRDKRFNEDGYPGWYKDHASAGAYELWAVMIEAFLQSGGKPLAGEPEFVLMQSDFNPQNILADDDGNVTGIIDWDCLESIPRQIGWCSLPHWLESDWYPDYHWPPEIDLENTAKPDDFDRYRHDYSGYIREACEANGGQSDSIFTPRTHIYQALFDSVGTFEKVECFVYNVLVDILPRTQPNIHAHVEEIGRNGFRTGERDWFEARLIRFFSQDPESMVPQ